MCLSAPFDPVRSVLAWPNATRLSSAGESISSRLLQRGLRLLPFKTGLFLKEILLPNLQLMFTTCRRIPTSHYHRSTPPISYHHHQAHTLLRRVILMIVAGNK